MEKHAKIIVTSRYIKPNSHKRFGNYIKYIATREGVEKPAPKQETNRELAVWEISFSVRNFTEYEDSDMTASNESDREDSQRNTSTNNIITSLLLTFGRLISDDYNRSSRGLKLRTEHKLKAAIRRKKQALGLKENPLENPQFRE